VTGLGMPRARVIVGPEGKRLASDGRVKSPGVVFRG
jgi:hypothetical protein